MKLKIEKQKISGLSNRKKMNTASGTCGTITKDPKFVSSVSEKKEKEYRTNKIVI